MRVVIGVVPARGPADDLQFVIVAMPDDLPAGVGQPAHDVHTTRRRGPVHRRGIVALLARVGIEPTPQQYVDDFEPSLTCRRVQQCPCVRRVAHLELVRMLVQQSGQRRQIAVARSVEQLAVHGERVGMRLQRAPTGESILLGKLELSVGELRRGVGLAHFNEQALGLLAQPFEIHGLRPFKPPGVRVNGRRTKPMD